MPVELDKAHGQNGLLSHVSTRDVLTPQMPQLFNQGMRLRSLGKKRWRAKGKLAECCPLPAENARSIREGDDNDQAPEPLILLVEALRRDPLVDSLFWLPVVLFGG